MTREELLAQADALQKAANDWRATPNAGIAVYPVKAFAIDLEHRARELRAQAEAMNNGAAQLGGNKPYGDCASQGCHCVTPVETKMPSATQRTAGSNPAAAPPFAAQPVAVVDGIMFDGQRTIKWFRLDMEVGTSLYAAPPDLAARVEELEAALRLIASCESRAPGDVVDIARAALTEGEK